MRWFRMSESCSATTLLPSTGGLLINIHIPALRRWTYPLIEGRPLEARASRNLLPASGDDSETVKTETTGATWRFS